MEHWVPRPRGRNNFGVFKEQKESECSWNPAHGKQVRNGVGANEAGEADIAGLSVSHW